MRLGVLGARADRRGLAVMTTEFCRHMKPDKVLGVEMPGGRNNWSDYDKATLKVTDIRRMNDAYVTKFLSDLDVCYMAETDYNPYRPHRHYITKIARDVGCKLVLHAMPEMCRFATTSPDRKAVEPEPDLIVLPTPWLADRFPNAVVLPFPVNRTLLPPVRRTHARRFLHLVGRPAMADRAGTEIVRAARPKAEVVVHVAMQKGSVPPGHMSVEVADRPDYHGIYSDFDVLVAPRRFGGQSLPLMEAASSAMPIIALDRDPEREWLPADTLIPVTNSEPKKMMGGPVDVADADPDDLAVAIDRLASSPSLVAELSDASDDLAQRWSWEELGPRWRDLLESLV